MENLLLYEKTGAIGRITFNDPERLNALSLEMAAEFPRIVATIRNDPELRCVIVTGAGRAFSAGGNLDMIEDKRRKSVEVNEAEMMGFYGSFLCIRDVEVPTIAYINGHAIGAGFCVALACDLRIAAEKAKLGVNFTKLGISPGMAGSWLITQLAGYSVAADLLFTGRTLLAPEAHQLGLVNQVLPAILAKAAVEETAQDIAANAPIAVREAKKVLLTNQSLSLDHALPNEAKAQAVCFQTEDLLEGVEAIRNKREPKFKGK